MPRNELEPADAQIAWQKAWDEWNRPPDTAEILGGRDPKTMTDEDIDEAFDRALARKLELGRLLFPPATGVELIQPIGSTDPAVFNGKYIK